MKFGSVPVGSAEGAILAHALKPGNGRLPKGTRLSAADVALIAAAGIGEIVAAVLEPGDLTEDEAAARIGAAAAGYDIEAGPAGTGRVNFFAGANGLLVPDRLVVDRLNAIDPGITLATLKEYEPVEAGRMVATVKIIPLAVPGVAVRAAVDILRQTPAFRLAPYRARRIALIQTELPGTKKSVLDKTRAALQRRLDASGSSITAEARCPHRSETLAEAIAATSDADMTIVFGASAVIDGKDVIPSAIEAAGGIVQHLGMPVDPGNLLLIGEVSGRPLIGAPGCARSPKENGFDWVLNRLLADIPVTGEEIRGMGVGGLLMEIATRPQPRERIAAVGVPAIAGAQGTRLAEGAPREMHGMKAPIDAAPVVDIAILAAGRSSRMGGPNKLLAEFDGIPLIRRSAKTALASGARRVRVVVGHMREEIAGALCGLDVAIVDNPHFADGLSTSLIAGLEAAAVDEAGGPDGLLVMLADQPLLKPGDLDRLIESFAPEGLGSIVVATDRGRRGNPVVLSLVYADAIGRLVGDVGARDILRANADAVRKIEIGAAASLDVDTPEAMAAAGGIIADARQFAG